MIVGNGIDIVDISRFRKLSQSKLDRLANRILTDIEYKNYTLEKDRYKFIAKVWAIKESVSKAFGTGISKNVLWKNIEFFKTELQQPAIKFLNNLKTDHKCFISVSHDGNYLIASCILTN